MKLNNRFCLVFRNVTRWVSGTCLLLVLGCLVKPASAQIQPPFRHTDQVRINTPQIQPIQIHIRINTSSSETLPTSSSVVSAVDPPAIPPHFQTGGPLLFQSMGETANMPPLPLRRNGETGFPVEPVVPFGSYSLPGVNGNIPPKTFENTGSVAPHPASSQLMPPIASMTSPEASQIDSIIQQGAILEKEGRWNEALGYYENAIRAFHKPPILMQRFRFARFHHDLTKRYNDPSFEMMLRQLTYSDAFALFDEVMMEIQQRYVDPPHWRELFENGMRDFEIALADPAFCRRHFQYADTIRIRSLSRKIVQTSQSWEIRDPRTLHAGIAAIAEICQKEIGLSPTAVVLEFLAGITNSLDPYTEFMTLNQFNDTKCMMSGNFVGLGVELKTDNISLYINRVIPGSPANKGGLQNLDRILEIDGTSIQGWQLEPASNLLQGEVDTYVRLLVQTGTNAPRELVIQREQLKVPSVENVHLLDDLGQNPGVGYLKLTGFQQDTVQEVREALLFLHRQGMKSLIIDLRGNAGGVLIACIETADLFLREGIIVRTKSRGAVPEDIHSAVRTTFTWDIPLAVLIDKDSASASEIFAGAILDNNRGLVVGQPSFGKDTVQMVLPLTGGKPYNSPAVAGLKLTIETYYSPKGMSFYGIGVQPNVPVSIVASNVPTNVVSNAGEPYLVNKPSSDDGFDRSSRQLVSQEDIVLKTAVNELRQRTPSATLSQNPTLTRYQPSVN